MGHPLKLPRASWGKGVDSKLDGISLNYLVRSSVLVEVVWVHNLVRFSLMFSVHFFSFLC